MSAEMKDPPRRAKGHRPQVFDDPAIDQLHAALLAVSTELAVAFERIDTLERLLEQRVGIERGDIVGYRPDDRAAADRAARRADLAERVLRPFRDYREDVLARAEHAQDQG